MKTKWVFALTWLIGLGTMVGCQNSSQSSSAESTVSKAGDVSKPYKLGQPFEIEGDNWKTEVLQAKEVVVVDFWAAWCKPCREMTPIMEALAKDYKVCKVNLDEGSNFELAREYQISSIPRLMIFRDGKKIYEHVGTTSEKELRDELRKLESQ